MNGGRRKLTRGPIRIVNLRNYWNVQKIYEVTIEHSGGCVGDSYPTLILKSNGIISFSHQFLYRLFRSLVYDNHF